MCLLPTMSHPTRCVRQRCKLASTDSRERGKLLKSMVWGPVAQVERGFLSRYVMSMGTLSPSEIRELSVAERIQLVQDLWDSIAAEPDVLPLTDDQRREIRRRSQAHRANPGEALPLDDVLSRIEHSLE